MNRTFLNNQIDEIKPNLSLNSKVQYTSILMKLLGTIEPNEESLKSGLSKDNIKQLIDDIESNYTSCSTRGLRYNCLILLVKHYFGELDERYLLLSQKRDQCNEKYIMKAEQGLTDKGKKNYVSTDEYKKMIIEWKPRITSLLKKDSFSKNEFMEIQSYYLSMIYLHIGLRADVSPMKVIYTKSIPDDMNYLQYYNRRYNIILNEYKTSTSYGQKILPVKDKDLVQGLTEYVSFLQKYNKRKEGLKLFSNKSNSDFLDQSALSTLYTSIFKVKLNRNFNIILNRKRVVSESVDVKEYLKAKEKVDTLANEMGHSLKMQTEIYNVNKEEQQEPEIKVKKQRKTKKVVE